jgi:hypothetical protein
MASLSKEYLRISSSNGVLKMERDILFMKRIMEHRGKKYCIFNSELHNLVPSYCSYIQSITPTQWQPPNGPLQPISWQILQAAYNFEQQAVGV